jgi:hypothetical protein
VEDSEYELPADWRNPDWNGTGKCHDWKNYISGEMQDAWGGFDDDQKQMIARNARSMTYNEKWN